MNAWKGSTWAKEGANWTLAGGWKLASESAATHPTGGDDAGN